MMNDICENCDQKITNGIADFSWKTFGKSLCIDCQKKERLSKYPIKLARFINKHVFKRQVMTK